VTDQLVELVVLFFGDLVLRLTPQGARPIHLLFANEDRKANEVGIASNGRLNRGRIPETLVVLPIELDRVRDPLSSRASSV
jgi:hypothetical protein